MKEYQNKFNPCFDDILLVPQYGEVKSRKAVDLSMDIGRETSSSLYLPVISSPMDSVTSGRMARAMADKGGLGIIHRYNSIEDRCLEVVYAADEDRAVGAAVGATGEYVKEALRLVDAGATLILVDVANGHSRMAADAVSELKDTFREDVYIMAGNVSTATGYGALAIAGADGVRVGIGGGSCCTTRLVSGHGLPTLASIMEIFEHKTAMRKSGFKYPAIIADGGIRNTGDMVKAFAAGADAVMLGSMLAGTDESAGEFINEQWKKFRGMASEEAQRDGNGGVSVIEGISTTIRRVGPLGDVLGRIRLGLGSGCSYSGVSKLSDLRWFAEYARVSQASIGESTPHA